MFQKSFESTCGREPEKPENLKDKDKTDLDETTPVSQQIENLRAKIALKGIKISNPFVLYTYIE